MRCEGLFIWGTLFLLIIAQESLSVTHSLRLSQVFQTIYLPNIRHLAGWLQSWNQRWCLCVSLSLFYSSPFSHSSHVKACAFWENFLYRRSFYWRAGVGPPVQYDFWGRRLDYMRWNNHGASLINANKTAFHLIIAFKRNPKSVSTGP